MPSLVGASSGVEAPIQTSPLASLIAVVRPPLLRDEPMQGQSEVGLSPGDEVKGKRTNNSTRPSRLNGTEKMVMAGESERTTVSDIVTGVGDVVMEKESGGRTGDRRGTLNEPASWAE